VDQIFTSSYPWFRWLRQLETFSWREHLERKIPLQSRVVRLEDFAHTTSSDEGLNFAVGEHLHLTSVGLYRECSSNSGSNGSGQAHDARL
jgi:hypothetical protein